MQEKTVCIVGLGYVGLPLAIIAAEKGYEVCAVDIDEKKVNLVNQNKSPIFDDKLQEKIKKVKIQASTNFDIIKKCKTVVVCVPTPVDENYEPDLKPLESACIEISNNLAKNQLIVIESTVNPGVCDGIVRPILEKSGLKDGVDFELAHCPERIDPGNKNWHVGNIPRVIGATTKNGLDLALNFYNSVINAEIKPMKGLKEAEATKIVENTFRDINIAFVNELAMSFDKMGIDVTEVLDGAATKPFAFMKHYPSRGIGGHCIPVDPYYLIKYAKDTNNFDHKFLKLARDINKNMPNYTVELLEGQLAKINKKINEIKVGVLGIAYKPNVDDNRESPTYKIIEILKNKNVQFEVFDPFLLKESSVKSLDELLMKVDVLIVSTPHDEFFNIGLNKLKENNIQVFIDGMNKFNKEEFDKSGILYKGIGR